MLIRASIMSMLSLIATLVACDILVSQTKAKEVAYVNVERVMLSHPMSAELSRLMDELDALRAKAQFKAALQMPTVEMALPSCGTFQILPEDIPQPNEPAIHAAKVDLSPLKRTQGYLMKLTEQFRLEGREKIGLLMELKRSEMREQYLGYVQSLLERQSPKRTRIRARLLSPSLTPEERSALVNEERMLDAELERELAKRKQQIEGELSKWKLDFEGELDAQFKLMRQRFEDILNDAANQLQGKHEQPKWVNLRELWRALSPRTPTPLTIIPPARRLTNNEVESNLHWHNLWEGKLNYIGCKWVSAWQSALRDSIIKFASIYALQRGFKRLATIWENDAVDITDEVIKALWLATGTR